MIRAVIFDHDGVIADTEPIHFRADNAVLSRFGFNITTEENSSMVGLSTKKSWEMLQKMFKLPEAVDWLVREKTSTVIKIIENEGIAPNPGLLQLLEKLESNGYKMAIASGQYRRVIDAVLGKLKISGYFDAVVSGEDTTNGKPHPEVFLTAAKKLNVKPQQCLVIEDSESGVTAAKAAGMACVVLKTAATSSHDLSAADAVVSSLNELKI